LPVFWSVLDKAGNSHTAERIALLKRFIAVFGGNNIAALLADREFVGEDWFAWLQAQAIPFHQRLKRNTRIPNAWNQLKRADQLFGSLKPGQLHHLPSRRPVWGCFVALSALRLNDGDWLIIASSDAPQTQAIEAYARRWEIETLFGCLKAGASTSKTPIWLIPNASANYSACSPWPLPGPIIPASDSTATSPSFLKNPSAASQVYLPTRARLYPQLSSEFLPAI